MRSRRWPQTLRHLDLFSGCSNAELRAVAPLLTAFPLEAGDVLMREGSRGEEFMIIAEGRVSVARSSHDPLVVGAGAFVGELALLDHTPRSATVTALTPLWLYVSTSREFDALLDRSPSVQAVISRVADERRSFNRQAA